MCMHLAQYDRALECHQKALDAKLCLLGEKSLDTAISFAWIGAVHAQRGTHENAIVYHKKALSVRLNANDKMAVASSHMYLARFDETASQI